MTMLYIPYDDTHPVYNSIHSVIGGFAMRSTGPVAEWCMKNIGYRPWIYARGGRDYGFEIEFRNDTAAALFKVKWL
jgi:hypothetical protein